MSVPSAPAAAASAQQQVSAVPAGVPAAGAHPVATASTTSPAQDALIIIPGPAPSPVAFNLQGSSTGQSVSSTASQSVWQRAQLGLFVLFTSSWDILTVVIWPHVTDASRALWTHVIKPFCRWVWKWGWDGISKVADILQIYGFAQAEQSSVGQAEPAPVPALAPACVTDGTAAGQINTASRVPASPPASSTGAATLP